IWRCNKARPVKTSRDVFAISHRLLITCKDITRPRPPLKSDLFLRNPFVFSFHLPRSHKPPRRHSIFDALQPASELVVKIKARCSLFGRPKSDPSLGNEKIKPRPPTYLRLRFGVSWSIPRLQLFTAAGLEPSSRPPSFRTQPRLPDDRSIVLAHAAVETDRLSPTTSRLYAGGYRLLLRRQP